MFSEWKKYVLSDCAELAGESCSPTDSPEDVYIGLEHIQPKSLRLTSMGKASDVSSTKLRFKANDILFGKLRPYFQKVVLVPFGGVCSTDIWVIRAKNDVFQKYMFYCLCDDNFINYTMEGADGTRMPRAKWEHASQYSIHLPPLPEQKAISHILGSLDDKIEINRKTNLTLEAMAKAIFKSWFVDYDPVKAKAEGRKPEGMDTETAKLFPDSFVDSELGKIPKGWKVGKVYDTAEYVNGSAFKDAEICDRTEGLPIVKIAEIKDGITSQTRFTSSEMPNKYLIQDGDILFSWSGSPDTSIDTFLWAGGRGWLNQHIFKVIAQESERYFVFFLLKYLRQTFIEIARDKQTTGLGHVTVADMKRLSVILPDSAIKGLFNKYGHSCFNSILQNIIEMKSLITLRNTLLPKLLSGELRIKDAEKFLEDVA